MKNNSYFDLSIFEKIEDIIYLDEPILSHLKLKEKDYFLYLVDSTEDTDIFIFFDIEENDIYKYLTKSISLRELIKSKNFVLLLEQDFDGNIVDTQSVLSNNIFEDYLPDNNSFLEYEPLETSYYYKKIDEYNRKLYLYDLRKNAFYIKFSTNDKKYGDTIGLRELTNTLLKNLSTSFKNFVEIDFEKKFNKIISDDSKRTSVLRAVLPDTDLRMVDLNYGSFEIGLSTDKLMKTNIEFKEVREWADNVGDSYKKIVLDDNIDNEELTQILENYTDEERNKIFEPVVKIVENENYNFKIKSSSQKVYKNLGLKKKDISNQIITKNKIKEEVPEKHLELISVTTIIDTNSKKKTINLENTLFSTVQETEHKLTYNDFKKYGYNNISPDVQIVLHLENNNNLIILKANYNNTSFDTAVENDKIDDGIRKMIDKIYEYIINLK